MKSSKPMCAPSTVGVGREGAIGLDDFIGLGLISEALPPEGEVALIDAA